MNVEVRNEAHLDIAEGVVFFMCMSTNTRFRRFDFFPHFRVMSQ
jgi:hypothetical protein